ncbi:glycosyltransferase family 4 protein [Streptomyces sp. NBC_00094]|uniref:glycosyltransferase family 4 protein n=1 Tax=Streptomyces sp. NBC_00094 TaxID=2903620 RepID=UPI002250D4D0|nr:glycosyltransferase family 4 protein [Streptomyces sp. NBC_00094]MCX5388916.1 glycosyltransferase family 4 protein [Streptomyces sp. NBC_00094]
MTAPTPATALDRLARTDLAFLNWRDPAHPDAGGAEAYCWEIARRFAAAGAHVTLVSSRYPGSRALEYRDGIRIVRGGGTFGVYAAAAAHLLRNRHAYDAVIDFQNGIPFFSPLFTPRWTADICVIHHVHQHQFDTRFHWPMNAVGRVLEKQVSRRVYRGRPVVVVSPSTREGARRELGFGNPLHIVPNGRPGAAASAPAGRRSDGPAVTVVSRLVPQKRVDLILRAVPALLRRRPELRVDICGDGPEAEALRKLAAGLGIASAVVFHGHVTEERKQELFHHAWLTVVPSVAEGWGLAVIEANTVGTPALAFDVPGLRDAIRPGVNGWLLDPDAELADGIAGALDELSAPEARRLAAARCRAWAAAFSWDHSAERLAQVVLEDLQRIHRHRRSRRSVNDLSVVTRFSSPDPDATERAVRNSLRQTDAWSRDGNVFRVLLHGCDEVRALGALRRLDVAEADVTLASGHDVLVGSAETGTTHSSRPGPTGTTQPGTTRSPQPGPTGTAPPRGPS